MPAMLRRLERVNLLAAEELAARLLTVHRAVRVALRLSTPDVPLGIAHPDCGGPLVLTGRQGTAYVRVVDGAVALDRGADEAVEWGSVAGIVCRTCGTSWHPSQARMLAASVETL
jgi:hypothetical protein